MFPGIFPRPWRVLGVLLLIAAVGAGIWAWERAGSSTEVSEERALQTYREGGGPSAARPGVPRAGVYTFRQSGSESGGAGPVDIDRDLPDRARYVVTPSEGGYTEELDMSEEHVEIVRLRVGPKRTMETWRRTEVTFLGIGRDDRRDIEPPAIRLQRPLTVGRTWTSSYRAGSLPVTTRSVVERAEEVELEGRRYATRVIRTVGDTGGIHPGRRVDVIWWSPALALPLRWDIEMEIRGTFSLRTKASLVLESAEPRV